MLSPLKFKSQRFTFMLSHFNNFNEEIMTLWCILFTIGPSKQCYWFLRTHFIKYNRLIKYVFIRELDSYLQATFGSAFRESSNSTHFKTCSSEPRAEHAVIKMVNLSIWEEKQRNPHTLGSVSKCLLYHAKYLLYSKIPNLFPSLALQSDFTISAMGLLYL